MMHMYVEREENRMNKPFIFRACACLRASLSLSLHNPPLDLHTPAQHPTPDARRPVPDARRPTPDAMRSSGPASTERHGGMAIRAVATTSGPSGRVRGPPAQTPKFSPPAPMPSHHYSYLPHRLTSNVIVPKHSRPAPRPSLGARYSGLGSCSLLPYR